MPFKICLTGCGHMAVNGHGPMLRKYASMRGDVELAGCCDVSMERAASFASSFGFKKAFADMSGMLDEIKPDAALLSVPVELTAKLSAETLARRIPLLTEKPPGATVEEGRAIAAAAKAAGVPASVAFNRRTMPLVLALIREIGAVGEPIDNVYIEMRRVNRTEPDFSTTAIHDVDLARHICRSDYRKAGMVYRVHGAAAPAADIHVLAEMESGAIVSLSFPPMCGMATERVAVSLHGHTFFAELPVYGSPDAPGRIVHMEGNRAIATIAGERYEDEAEANGFLGEHVSFFDAVREGREPAHSVEDSLQSLEVAGCLGQRLAAYAK
jgi:myo-inositol 2-dehydrogenase/D-chiro-inositol 1-dehydrogenase